MANEEKPPTTEDRLTALETRLSLIDAAFVKFAKDYPNIHAGYFVGFLKEEAALSAPEVPTV
jgi:hypothetical protein